MSRLLHAIVHGFGFTLGARAADAAIEEVAEHEAREAKSAEEAKARTKALLETSAREARASARQRAKLEKDVQRELVAMKKRLAKEAKKKG